MKIHREQIISTALVLLDRDGLEGISLRRVANELHVHAGALYWHVQNKQDLLDELANMLLAEQFPDFEESPVTQDWIEWLTDICQRLRRAMLAHREGARVVAGANLRHATALRSLIEMIMRGLINTGFSLHQANLACSTALSYVYGFVIEEQAFLEITPASDVAPPEESLIAAVIVENQDKGYTSDMDFEAGLDMVLSGIKLKNIVQETYASD